MKVIFLDIDGVLNSWATTPKEEVGGIFGIHKVFVDRFNKLVKDTGAKVVLSSVWRYDPKWRGAMKAAGLCDMLDRTGNRAIDGFRGEEVRQWLSKHPEVTKYAILDDDGDFYPDQPLFQTPGFQKGALTEEICEQVRHYLTT